MKRATAQPVERPVVTGDAEALAQRVLAATPISKPVEMVAEVLTLTAAGGSQRKVATATGVSASTVGRIVQAARELDEDTAAGHPTERVLATAS